MAIEEWETTTVYGNYVDDDGAPRSGSVDFFLPYRIQVGGRVVLPIKRTAKLNGAGHFSIDLARSDDPDIMPVGWVYLVRERIRGSRYLYMIRVGDSPLPVNITELILTRANPLGGTVPLDHGSLTGLLDDDHPQYLTDARANGLYYAKALIDAMLADKVSTSDARLSNARVPLAHNHPTSELTASGSPSSVTFLRGDGTWAAPPSGGGGGVTDHSGLTGRSSADSHPTGAITGLDAALADKVTGSRLVQAGAGLSGGGDLSTDRTLAVVFGTSATTAAAGNDSRLSNTRTPTAHAASHATGGSDPVSAGAIGAALASHVHDVHTVTGEVVSYSTSATVRGTADLTECVLFLTADDPSAIMQPLDLWFVTP